MHETKVGAYAIVVIDRTIKNSCEIHAYAKEKTSSSIMEYEAIKLALEYLIHAKRSAKIFSDNMACVRTVNAILSNDYNENSRAFNNKVVRKIKNIITCGIRHPVQCIWVKGHNGLEYNVLADKVAKTAARDLDEKIKKEKRKNEHLRKTKLRSHSSTLV